MKNKSIPVHRLRLTYLAMNKKNCSHAIQINLKFKKIIAVENLIFVHLNYEVLKINEAVKIKKLFNT